MSNKISKTIQELPAIYAPEEKLSVSTIEDHHCRRELQ